MCEWLQIEFRSPTHASSFMDSLQWVDQTYVQKHRSEDPAHLRSMYYPNLRLYSTHGDDGARKSPMDASLMFLSRFGRRAALSLAIFALSYVPIIGRLVLPAVSFYTFNKAVGPIPAVVIFGSSIFLPRSYLVVFLQSYFSSRSLMRELVSVFSATPWISLPYDRQDSTNRRRTLAGSLFRSHPIHQRTKGPLVSRSRRPSLWLWRRLLRVSEDTRFWSAHLWHRRGLDGLPHYEDHRSTPVTDLHRWLRRESGPMEEQERVLATPAGQDRCT